MNAYKAYLHIAAAALLTGALLLFAGCEKEKNVASNTKKDVTSKHDKWECITDKYSIKITIYNDKKMFCAVKNISSASFFFQDSVYYKYTTYSSTASKSDTLCSITHQWNDHGDTEKVANEIYRIHKQNEESVLVEYAGFAPDIPCKDCILTFIFRTKNPH